MLNITLPAVSALPSSRSVTSMSVSDNGLVTTFTEMLICGWVVCWSEPGAFGFFKERSLVYCARTMSWGAELEAVASNGPPLGVLTIYSPSNCDGAPGKPRGG